MKVVALTLALLFITESQGRYLWQNDAPSHPGEVLLASVHDYVEAGKDNTKKFIQEIEGSQLGQQLDLKIADTLSELDVKAQEAKKSLTEYLVGWRQRLRKEGEPVMQQARTDLANAYNKIVPILEPLGAKLSNHLKENKDKLIALAEEMRGNAQVTSATLKEKIKPLTEELFQKVREAFEHLKPVAEKVHQRYAPLREKLHGHVSHTLADVKERLSSTAVGTEENVGPVLQSLRSYVAAILENASQAVKKISAA